MAIFAVTGALIGFYLDHAGVLWIGTLLGAALGAFIGRLGARRFFYSVLGGALVGGILGWLAGGVEVIPVTAGSGSAIGGFIGINIELFVRYYQEGKNRRPS